MGLFKDIKSAFKGSKEYQKGKAKKKAVKAKKKEGKTWTKAVKRQKKTGGSSMNELIKKRNAADKGTAEYVSAQNAINKAYKVKKRHKTSDTASKKASKKVGDEYKKEYQDGGKVLEAAAMGQELESISLNNIESDYPIEDAAGRSETYQLGGSVRPPTAPSMPQYKKGGKVK